MSDQDNRAQPVALYLNKPQPLSPNWEEFQRAAAGRFPIAVWDPSKPFAEQVQGVLVVVDDGGSQGTREMIDLSIAAGVKLWHVTTNGLDHIDVAYFLEKGMPLAHAPGPQSAVALAEHALAVIFHFNKNLHRNRGADWSQRFVSSELQGQVLGLIGLGASARELTKRATCLGMRVRAIDLIPVSETVRQELNVEWFGDPGQLMELAAASDFLSVHVPLTSKTRKLVNREVLHVMKPSAVVINVARGEIIDEAALIEALQAGHLKGAGLDVYDCEPPAPTNPLFSLPNVLATPHIAGASDGTFRRRAQAAADNAERIMQGLPPNDVVRALE